MPRLTLRRFFRHGILPQLMVFEAVARLGSVTRAARELHLAQPTVSLQLKKLSLALELPLFEQRGRQLQLLAAGEALREVCAELIQVLSRAEERLSALREPSPETVRLAAEPESRASAARLIASFCSRHPGIQVSLHVAERAELLARFAAGDDDVYLFELDIDGLPADRRWSVAHPRGRALAAPAALFLRDALRLDATQGAANNPADSGGGDKQWKFRGNTTRR